MPEKVRFYPIIAGPTASGKTALAVAFARQCSGEVVSADSMQIYRDISIGTARPSADETQGIPHHLQGFLPLTASYSVARYVEDANRVFAEIYDRGNLPVMCGGTGLYIQSFMENITFFPQQSNPHLREVLLQKAADDGGKTLLDELRRMDPEAAARLHENDVHRLVRALEVYFTTGMTITEQAQRSRSHPSPYTPCLFVLNYRDREKLYARIEQRVNQMMDAGLLQEAQRLFEEPGTETVLQAIGYKELLPYLRGEISLKDAVDHIKIGTRHYAKRQLSWFRRIKDARFLYVDDYADETALLQDALNQYKAFCGKGEKKS